MRVLIDSDSRSFIREGKHFFYQADTLWMDFFKLDPSEWEKILRVRRNHRYGA